MRVRFSIGFVLLLMLTGVAGAETLYVTDRILLGVHQEPQEESLLIKSIVSGTAVEVIEKGEAFIKVKLLDGTEGWVSSGYLKKEKPAIAEMDKLYKKYEEASAALKTVNDQLGKRERELQVRRDELSNAKTTIKDLKKQIAQGGGAPVVDTEQLAEAQKKIDQLSQQLAEATAAKEAAEQTMQDSGDVDVISLQQENTNLRARIRSAVANLNGETVPTPEQLAAIRPDFPFWYWLLVFVVLIVGVIGGILWMDYRNRLRHGGFRV